MKKIGLLIVLFTLLNSSIFSQSMIENIFPRYIGGKNGSSTNSIRMNAAFRITLTGLNPSANYRITSGVINSADNATSNGAGVFWLPGITSSSVNAGTLTSITETVATNLEGSASFWIVIQPTGNARFEPGIASENLLFLRIGLNDGSGGSSILTRITSTSSIIPLDLASTARTPSTDDDGAFIEGEADISAAGKFVFIWDEVSVSGRPINGYIIEDNNIVEGTNTPSFYQNNIAGISGKYGLVLPSNNSNGIRRIEAFNFDGSSFAFATDEDGLWPNSNTNTVNPSRGTILIINSLEAPLPVELSSFSASVIGSSVKLNWRTETETNNYGFEVERKVGSPQSTVGNYEKIGFVEGYGNSYSPKSYSFNDNSISSGKLSYRLKQIDNDGSFSYSKTIDLDLGAPRKYELTQNFPNPFNPNTAIRFSLPETGNVKLTVYNLLGQEVAVLVSGLTEAGTHIINFDAAGFNSGVYIYRIESGSFNEVRKMTLIK